MTLGIDITAHPLVSPTLVVFEHVDNRQGSAERTEIRLSGTGLGVDAAGIIDRGTIEAIEYITFYTSSFDGTMDVTQRYTIELGQPLAGADYHDAVAPLLALRSEIFSWSGITESSIGATPAVTIDTLTFPITDGTYLVIRGAGFDLETTIGTITQIDQLAADGSTVLNTTGPIDFSVSEFLTALGTRSGPIDLLLLQGDDLYKAYQGMVILPGSAGDDTISGPVSIRDGQASVEYQSSSSSIVVDNSLGRVTGPDGTDHLADIIGFAGSNFDDVMVGSDDLDVFHGAAGDDFLDGRDGDDWFDGGTGSDTILGGDGNDTLGDDDESLGGFNVLDGEGGNDALFSGRGNDFLIGGDGNDRLFADDGNDTLIGGSGNDSLFGESGADVFVVRDDASSDRIFDFNTLSVRDSRYDSDIRVTVSTELNPSHNQVSFGIFASDGIDVGGTTPTTLDNLTRITLHIGSPDTPELFVLYGPGGTGTSPFDSYVNASWSGSTLEQHLDDFFSGDVFLVFYTVGAADGLFPLQLSTSGIEIDDVIDVGAWGMQNFADVSAAMSGTSNGGTRIQYGSNILTIDDIAPTDFTADDFIYAGSSVVTPNLFINGTPGNDKLRGSSESDLLNALDGDDTITLSDGSDTIIGGDGQDVLMLAETVILNLNSGRLDTADGATCWVDGIEVVRATGNSADGMYGSTQHAVTLHGGGGNDALWTYANAGDLLTASAGTNVLAALGSSTAITGGYQTDYILTSYGDNTVNAGDGNDWVYVRYGSNLIDLGDGYNLLISNDLYESSPDDYFADSTDTVIGGAQDDYIYSGRGNDSLVGNAGNDWLAGGAGNDTLDGGDGYDRYIFADETGFDVVTAFVDGEDFLDFTTSSLVTSFDDLTLTTTADGVDITWNAGQSGVTLTGISLTDISAADILL